MNITSLSFTIVAIDISSVIMIFELSDWKGVLYNDTPLLESIFFKTTIGIVSTSTSYGMYIEFRNKQ